MWKRQQHGYGQTPAATTPYQKAAQVWDARMGSARVQARNWRLMALMSLGLACALAAAFVWRSSSSLITPYVVELESNGDIRAVKSAIAHYDPTDAQIAHQLAAFIQNVRSVSIDPIVVRENWLKAYAYTTDQAALSLNQYARDHDPFAEVGKRSVSVTVASVVRSSADSFELRWRETTYLSGVQQSQATHTAILSVILKPPTTEETLHRNPLGLYVHGINWSKDLLLGDTQ
ncbi:MAG: conjugal transfer protein TrbF [Pseudomonadota bacterium]